MIGLSKDYGKLKFVQMSEYSGDCTCGWSITFNNGDNNAVEAFVDEVLKSRDFDWGSIDIVIGGRRYFDVIEYSHGKIVKQKDEFDSFANSHIVRISAGGGWSKMDYTVTIA